jgi:hypothetical protein
MLSSRHTDQMEDTSSRLWKENVKPLAVVDCNEHKAEACLFDQRSYGTLEHKTVK